MDIIIKSWSWLHGKKEELVPLRFTNQGYIRRKDQRRLMEALKRYEGRRVRIEVIREGAIK